MILVSLALLIQSVPVLGAIGRQELPARGCAVFLWRAGDEARPRGPVAMASADPARLRLSLDGVATDLARVAQRGETGFGLGASTEYRGANLAVTLDLAVATRADLRDGAAVPQATLSIVRGGGDALVLPLAGLIGCRPGP
jgi:hypothetical protein